MFKTVSLVHMSNLIIILVYLVILVVPHVMDLPLMIVMFAEMMVLTLTIKIEIQELVL